MKKISLGILGCGAIGRGVAEFIDKNMRGKINIKYLYDKDKKKALLLQNSLNIKTSLSSSLDKLIDKCEYILEAASQSAAEKLMKLSRGKKKKLIIVSSGVFLANRKLAEEVQNSSLTVYVPSGAVAGIDGIKAHAASGIKKIEIITSKPPAGLGGRRMGVIFEGSASAAVKLFPKNINVASTLSLASKTERLKVTIKVSSNIKANSHYINLVSNIGRLKVKVENFPSQNPRTSQLAIFSVISLLEDIVSSLKVGN